jgi:hypothetical protein
MRLSESLKRNIMETSVGRLLNKFKIKSRRNVLFFEDILANYIKECEKAGYEKEIRDIAKKWMNLTMQQMTPQVLKRTPMFFLNVVMKKVWTNLGLMDDLKVSKQGNLVNIETKNEGITTFIGKNNFTLGLFIGILNVLFKSEIECIDYLQTKRFCKYSFKIKNEPFLIHSKGKNLYDKLNNSLKTEGFNLEDAFQKNIFKLKRNNRIYFRRTVIRPAENTLFHLISNENILIEKVPVISYNYFHKIIKEKTTKERKLYLLKNILEANGWGIIKIIIYKKKILFKIKNPPYGLQLEKNNWNFLAATILGYLWLLDKKFRIYSMNDNYKQLIMTYSN